MTWFETLKNQILIVFPNMPTSYIENAIIRAASTFFRETHLLKDEAYINAECNIDDFVIDIDAGRTIVQIKEVFSCSHTDKHPLLDESWRCVPPAPHRFGYGYWVELHGAQPTITFGRGTALRSGGYCVVYSWCPDTKTCELPQHFIGKYIDALEHGALGNLFLIPMENDTQSTTLAKYHLQEFYRAIKNAGVEEEQNHTARPLFMQGGNFL